MQAIGMLLLTAAMFAFEYANYDTTLATMTRILGAEAGNLAWALAIAFTAVDIGGVARIFTREEVGESDQLDSNLLLVAWAIAVIVNGTLTYDEIAYNMGANNAFTTGFREWYPAAIAIALVFTRFTLVRIFGHAFDEFLNKALAQKKKKAQASKKPGGKKKSTGAHKAGVGSRHTPSVQAALHHGGRVVNDRATNVAKAANVDAAASTSAGGKHTSRNAPSFWGGQ